MARPLRVEYPGALYHITVRGNARQKSFLKQNTEIPKKQCYIARKEFAEIFQEGFRSGRAPVTMYYMLFSSVPWSMICVLSTHKLGKPMMPSMWVALGVCPPSVKLSPNAM